ncbi:hypothetical protein ACJQWK_06938 [Exserohilum turcicum]
MRNREARNRNKTSKYRPCYIGLKITSIPCHRDGRPSSRYEPRTQHHEFDTAVPQAGDNFFEDMLKSEGAMSEQDDRSVDMKPHGREECAAAGPVELESLSLCVSDDAAASRENRGSTDDQTAPRGNLQTRRYNTRTVAALTHNIACDVHATISPSHDADAETTLSRKRKRTAVRDAEDQDDEGTMYRVAKRRRIAMR